jgi:DNA-directed RNA polymerase subunit RPC12/RpoP
MDIFLNCPYCDIKILLNENEIFCAIFRCGIYKSSYQQINPHLPKLECNRLKELNLIYGCGGAFQLINNNKEYKLIKCEYI